MSSDAQDDDRRLVELQATISGLTQELVELSERVRRLEDELEADTAGRSSGAARKDTSDQDAGNDDGSGEGPPPDIDDIIVA